MGWNSALRRRGGDSQNAEEQGVGRLDREIAKHYAPCGPAEATLRHFIPTGGPRSSCRGRSSFVLCQLFPAFLASSSAIKMPNKNSKQNAKQELFLPPLNAIYYFCILTANTVWCKAGLSEARLPLLPAAKTTEKRQQPPNFADQGLPLTGAC